MFLKSTNEFDPKKNQPMNLTDVVRWLTNELKFTH